MGPDVELTSETLQFPKLNGTNYHTWADNMKAVLQAKSLWGVVSGCEHCPPCPPLEYPSLPKSTKPSAIDPEAAKLSGKEPEESSKDPLLEIFQLKEFWSWELAVERYEKWLNKDNAAMGLMCNAIEYTQRECIVDMTSSYMMWNHLHKNYVDQQSGFNVHYQYQQLYLKKWERNSPILDHIAFFLNIHHCFIKAGHRVDDITVINTLLLSLPHTATWKVVKQNLLDQGDQLTLEIVSTELATVYERTVQEDLAGGVKTLALVMKDGSPNSSKSDSNTGSNKGGNGKKGKGKGKGKQQPKPEDICHTCGEKGHWSPMCPKKPKKGNSGQKPNSTNIAVNNDLWPVEG
jgi:hypothetical protein